ncbi:nitrogen fixation protein NifZ [Rhodoferax sp. 4810]|nr:nitrogen fixation protein NifZ [Rhodoferax jenense]
MTTPATTPVLPGLEPRAPAYAWGQRVIALDDLINDGSHPEREADALLAARGSVGEIVNIGHAPDLNEPVYLVQFADCVVGCLEIELVPAPLGLLPETPDVPEPT